MRRYLRKPNKMTTSVFYARLVELNEHLTCFPNATEKSKLSQEELVKILELALPNTWCMHMTLAQFVCSEKSPTDILNLCKEIEGIKAKHGDLSVAGVHDTRCPSDKNRHTPVSLPNGSEITRTRRILIQDPKSVQSTDQDIMQKNASY